MNKYTYAGYFYVYGALSVNGMELPEAVVASLRASFRDLTPRKIDDFKRSEEIVDLLRKRSFSSKFDWLNKDVSRDCDWAPEGKAPNPNTCWLKAERQVLERTGCDP